MQIDRAFWVYFEGSSCAIFDLSLDMIEIIIKLLSLRLSYVPHSLHSHDHIARDTNGEELFPLEISPEADSAPLTRTPEGRKEGRKEGREGGRPSAKEAEISVPISTAALPRHLLGSVYGEGKEEEEEEEERGT